MTVGPTGLTSEDINRLLGELEANRAELKANELELNARTDALTRDIGNAVQAQEAASSGDQNASALREEGLRLQQSVLSQLAQLEAERRQLDDQVADLLEGQGQNS